jgi:hypothetical protein
LVVSAQPACQTSMDGSLAVAARHRPRPRPQPQACDPCRSRKEGCDRARPVCQRCLKRDQRSQCVYSHGLQASLAVSSASPSRPSRVAPPSDPRAPEESAPIKAATSTTASDSNLSGPAKPTAMSGYFGFTSYSAVFAETKQSLSLFAGDSPVAGADAGPGAHAQLQSSQRLGISFAELTTPVQEMCLYVLRCLPGQSNEIMVFQSNPSDSRGQFHLAVDRIIATLQETFASLQHLDEPSKLQIIADRICNNTAKPFRDIHSSADEYMAQYCGKGLRWESLGLLCAHLERISDILDARRNRRVEWIDGRERDAEARSCLNYCIQLSQQFCEGNDLLLDLCRRLGTLDSVIDGDGSKRHPVPPVAPLPSYCSQSCLDEDPSVLICSLLALSCALDHGVTVSLLHFLGIHALPDPRPYVPSLCSEHKRRLFAQTFVSDKLNATFTGRPPLLSPRYCSTPLPLDLSDEELTSDSATLLRAVEALDAQGWNTKGEINPVTLIRARFQVAALHDELMEIALSPRLTTTIEHVLYVNLTVVMTGTVSDFAQRDLKQRAIDVATRLPRQLQYNLDDYFKGPSRDIVGDYVRHIIRREHLLGVLFAERLLLRLGYPDEGNILLTSFELLAITLMLWTHKDSFSWSHRHFAWLVSLALSYLIRNHAV